MKEKNSEDNTYVEDERIKTINQKGLAACGAVAIFYSLGKILYMGFAKNKLALPELILFLIFSAIIWFNNIKNNNYDFSEYGKKYDTSLTGEGKRSRLKKYAVHNLMFAVTFTAADLIFLGDVFSKSIWLEGALTFIGLYIIGFTVDYLVNENKVKKYNKFMDSLEEQEQEDF